MESRRFDAIARDLAGQSNRRSLLRGLAAAVVALVAGGKTASAGPGATVKVHNAECLRNTPAQDISRVCYQNGFGPVTFRLYETIFSTDARGDGSILVPPGRYELEQDAEIVARSRRITARCIGRRAGRASRTIFNGTVRNGTITIGVFARERVTCEWYNIWKDDQPPFRMKRACSTPTLCTTDSDCSSIPGATCFEETACLCPFGTAWNVAGTRCDPVAAGSGGAICTVGWNIGATTADDLCSVQFCDPSCTSFISAGGLCATATDGGFACVRAPGRTPCTSNEQCTDPQFPVCADFHVADGKLCSPICT